MMEPWPCWMSSPIQGQRMSSGEVANGSWTLTLCKMSLKRPPGGASRSSD